MPTHTVWISGAAEAMGETKQIAKLNTFKHKVTRTMHGKRLGVFVVVNESRHNRQLQPRKVRVGQGTVEALCITEAVEK